jgi:hypothetical protein
MHASSIAHPGSWLENAVRRLAVPPVGRPRAAAMANVMML